MTQEQRQAILRCYREQGGTSPCARAAKPERPALASSKARGAPRASHPTRGASPSVSSPMGAVLSRQLGAAHRSAALTPSWVSLLFLRSPAPREAPGTRDRGRAKSEPHPVSRVAAHGSEHVLEAKGEFDEAVTAAWDVLPDSPESWDAVEEKSELLERFSAAIDDAVERRRGP
jgi:hypothetical protein